MLGMAGSLCVVVDEVSQEMYIYNLPTGPETGVHYTRPPSDLTDFSILAGTARVGHTDRGGCG
jgi:hypothetical protein